MFLCYVGNSLFTILSGYMQKIHTLWRCIISALCMIIGLMALMIFPCVGILLAAVFLRGSSDGLLTVAMRQYVRNHVPASIHTLSHSLCNAFYASLGGTVGIAIVTKLYSQFGIAGMSWFCSALGLVGVGLCFVLFWLLRHKHNSESQEMQGVIMKAIYIQFPDICRFAFDELRESISRLFSEVILTETPDSADLIIHLQCEVSTEPIWESAVAQTFRISCPNGRELTISAGSPAALFWGVCELTAKWGVFHLISGDVYTD